jgi:hypothetical protein
MHRPQREKVHAKSDNITNGLTLSKHWASYLFLQAFQLHLRQLPLSVRNETFRYTCYSIVSAEYKKCKLSSFATPWYKHASVRVMRS